MDTATVSTIGDIGTDADPVIRDVADQHGKATDSLEYLGRVVRDRHGRLLIATKSSTRFAAAVAAFLDDPEGVGTNELREEYARFMGVHAGNFYSMPAE